MYRDSVLAVPTAILQNPLLPTPIELARDMVMLEVMHYDFRGRLQRGHIIVHTLVSDDVRAFFKEAFRLRFPIHRVTPVHKFHWQDVESCKANNSSGHNMRFLEAGGMSRHGIGCAFDINPLQNPCYVLDETKPLLPLKEKIPPNGHYDPGTPGTLQKGDALVELMVGRGWTWGGNWKYPKDYQHFEIVPLELASYVE